MGILSWFRHLSPENPGVYRIRNKVSGRAYIGSTVRSMAIRWGEHRMMLRELTHPNKALQEEWGEYGKRSFSFEVLEIVPDREKIRMQEAFWQSQELNIYSDRGVVPVAHRQRRQDRKMYYPGAIELSSSMPPDDMLFLLALLRYADGEYRCLPHKIATLLMDELPQEYIFSQVALLRKQWHSFPCDPQRNLTERELIAILAIQIKD